MNNDDELKQKREAVYSGFRENTQELYKLFREHLSPDGTEAEIQYKMGIMLCGENPSPQDYQDAAQLFKLSAAQGNKEAKNALEKLPVIRLKHELAMLQTTESKRAATPIDKRKTVPDSSTCPKRVPLCVAELRLAAETEGVPPIVLAAIRGDVVSIDTLAAAGEDVNATDPVTGVTPLHIAAGNGNLPVIRVLMKLKAKLDILDKHNHTPLSVSASRGTPKATIALLKAGANASIAIGKDTILEVARTGKTAEHEEIVRLLEKHFKKYPNGIKPKSNKKKLEKKNEQEKKPETRQEEKPKARQQKSSAQGSSLTKTVSVKTLFSNALQTKITELAKMRSKIDEMRKLQARIMLDIKTSSDRLAQPLKDVTTNKDRHLKLEANLVDLRSVERYDASVKAQETLLNNILALLQGSQGTLTDEALQKNLTVVDDKTKSKPVFTVEEFLALRQALTENESISDEIFSSGLTVLEAKYASLFVMVSELNENLIKLSGFWQTRATEHLTFGICTKEEESQRVLPAAKISRIEGAVAQIKSILDKRIKTEAKTTQDRIVQNSQKTSASQSSGSQGSENESSESARRVARAARGQGQQPADRESQEENALFAPKKKLSKAARKKAYEEQKAAKAVRTAARLEAYRQKQAAKHAEALQKEQVSARAHKLKAILAGTEMFPECETKTVREEKTTVERQNPIFKEETIESYNELQKLKSIIKIIKKTGVWTPERKYAVLQSFAFLNDILSVQHEHPATRAVAKCLRNAIFKQYKEVMNIVQSDASLLVMVDAWVTFLETSNDICFFVNERAVLDKVSSDWLSRVYGLGEALLREVDIDKSCIAFEEMMDFGRCQRYETACSIRLILGKIRKFRDSIQAGHEIIITPDEQTFIVYYKNKNNCEVASFHCDTDQRALLLQLMFNGEKLARGPSTEEIYKQIYAAITSREGCTRFGDDVIGCEAARFYWAITGTERGTLEQAAKVGNGRALALLKQFALQLFRPEHLERGKRARHFKVLEEETKNSQECVDTDSTVLLFARNMPPYAANLPNRQPHSSLSPVVSAVTFVFPGYVGAGAPTVNSEPSGPISDPGQKPGQQVKSESLKREGP